MREEERKYTGEEQMRLKKSIDAVLKNVEKSMALILLYILI